MLRFGGVVHDATAGRNSLSQAQQHTRRSQVDMDPTLEAIIAWVRDGTLDLFECDADLVGQLI